MDVKEGFQKFGIVLKKHLDAVVLFVNTLIILIIGLGSIWRLGFHFNESFTDLLNATLLIMLFPLFNAISIIMLVGKRRSALFAILCFVSQSLIFFILMFMNLLFVILLGLNILAVVFCIKKRPILPRFKTKNGFFILLLIIILLISPVLLYFGTSRLTITLPARENPNFRVSFYCEYYNNETFTNENLLALESHNSRIFLAINESQIVNNSLALNVTKRLMNANVSVYAWLLLNYSKGYWAADSNVLDFEQLVNNFTSWASTNSLVYDGIMIDSEPDYQRMQTLEDQIASFSLFKVLTGLRKTAVSAQHEFAKEKYEEIITNIQKSGYEAMMVGFPMPVDDYPDGDDTLQRVMGVSTIPPDNWNYSSFMIYRTTYKELLTVDFGSYFVYSYAKSIWKFFGNTSSVSLARCDSDPYNSVDDLIRDALIVKNLGFDEVIWISMERFNRAYNATALNNFLDAVNTTQSVSFNYNPWGGYSRLLLTFIDRIGII